MIFIFCFMKSLEEFYCSPEMIYEGRANLALYEEHFENSIEQRAIYRGNLDLLMDSIRLMTGNYDWMNEIEAGPRFFNPNFN